MGDSEDVAKSVKRTQEQLGRFVKKPSLTDKNLSRPPFRFLHDIIHNVIDTTGFMNGVFSPEELDASSITSRDAKAAFMQKAVQAIKDKTGDDVPLKISKVLAGLEADKTNNLLQSLAKAIEAHQQNTGGPAPPVKKSSGGTKKTPAGGASKPKPTSKPDTKRAPGKKDALPGTKRSIRDPSLAGKLASKQGKHGEKSPDAPSSGSKSKTTTRSESKAKAQSVAPVVVPENTEPIVLPTTDDDPPPLEPPVPAKRSASLARKQSSADMNETLKNAPDEMDSNTGVDTGLDDDNVNVTNDVVGAEELYDNFAASVVKPNMQTLPPPITPIYTDADAVIATMSAEIPISPQTPARSPVVPVITPTPSRSPLLATPTPIRSPLVAETPTPGPSLTPSPLSQIALGGGGGPLPGSSQMKVASREASAETKGSPFGSATIGEIRPPTGQNRPGTGTAGASRMSSARPPSARRAPPRPKSSIVKEEIEPYRPTTGKVAHVIMDDAEDPDDDNYVVREITVTASKPNGLSDLDETPELALSNGLSTNDGLDSILPPEQRGLLVNQILETQKELEDKSGKGDGDTPVIEKKLKELSLAEIEKLKNLIQICARSANPLAKLLDYMAEDVDSMQKEYNRYREDSKRLSMELENARGSTEKFLQNLKHDLHEVERKIRDKQGAILASQMKIIQQEERIEEIVTGFERHRSGKSNAAEKHMPLADEILAHIQGQSSYGSGHGSGIGGPAGNFSAFSANSQENNNNRFSASAGGGNLDSFKIPESFGNTSNNNGASPFSRGRMWSSQVNGSFERVNSTEDDQQPSLSSGSGKSGFSMQRNTGRSGIGGMNNTNTFRRTATNSELQIDTDVENFNPWT